MIELVEGPNEFNIPLTPIAPAECWIDYVKATLGLLWTVMVNGEVIFQQTYVSPRFSWPIAVSPGDYHVEVTECGEWQTITDTVTYLRCNELIGPVIFDFTLNEGETATCDGGTGEVTIT